MAQRDVGTVAQFEVGGNNAVFERVDVTAK
jgi:hypothetical protein